MNVYKVLTTSKMKACSWSTLENLFSVDWETALKYTMRSNCVYYCSQFIFIFFKFCRSLRKLFSLKYNQHFFSLKTRHIFRSFFSWIQPNHHRWCIGIRLTLQHQYETLLFSYLYEWRVQTEKIIFIYQFSASNNKPQTI